MQRYRVNLPLLIGLVVGSIVLVGGSYGLYAFQKSRNANRLLEREEVARAEGDLEQSAKLLIDYLRIRPGDEEAMARLSLTLADVAQEPTAEPRAIRDAIGQLEATVRDFPERDDLRRRLVDLYMSRRVRMLKPALDHVSQLLNRKPGDPELEVMRSECYFAAGSAKAVDHGYKLIGFDKITEEFDASKAIAPDNPGVYMRLANAARTEQYDEKFADRIIEQMIEANPDSGEAHLARGQYLELHDEADAAVADIEKALELDPDNTSIVISNARLAAREEEYQRAEKLLTDAIAKNPEEPGLYQTLADVIIRQGRYDDALACCDRGIAAAPEEQSQLLMLQKARLQLQSDTPEDVRDTIREMREGLLIPAAYPDYLEARLKMANNEWFEAATTFEKYQSFMANIPSLGVELNVMLGLCREKLGQFELASEAFAQALTLDPKNSMADLGRQRVMSKQGIKSRDAEGLSIYTELARELAKPESQQDWEAFDDLAVNYIERLKLGDAMLAVLRGEVLMRRGKYPEARQQLIDSYRLDPKNLGVRRAAVKLFAADPEKGPVQALGLLDKVVDDFGDMPILRLERADLLTVINDEDLTDQLFDLTDGIDDWDQSQKVQLWRGLAEKFGRLRNDEARAECLAKVAELAPSDLPTLLEMFAVSRDSGDAAGVKEAQDRILKVVGSKQNATWQYTEASRLLAEWRASGGQGEGLQDADELVDRAISQRGDWNLLYNLKADIAIARNDIKGALASYDRATKLGRQDARSLLQYIKLLTARGRYNDALDQMEKIGAESRKRVLGRDYAESLLRVGRGAQGVVAAISYADEAPNNAAIQLWLGRYLTQASVAPDVTEEQKEKLATRAGEAFNKAVENDPNASDAWLALVGYHRSQGDIVQAGDTIRRAQLALVEDQSQLLFARCYELVGRGIDAEALYKQALEQANDADRARVSRLLAQFYLGPAYRRDDGRDQATPLINQVLKDAADGVIKPSDPNSRWARSTAARLLASSGAYQSLRDAEKLIASNSTDGDLPTSDQLLMAEILAPRPEPVSRLKAARLLEAVGANQRLSKKSDLDLGRLYFALGKWRECREQMQDVIARYPKDPSVRLAYIEMLLQRGGPTDIDRAVQQVKRLKEFAPNDLATREVLARIANDKGKKREAAATLLSMLPRDLKKITPEQLPLVNRVASRLIDFEQIEPAGKLLQLAAQRGGMREKVAFAKYTGSHVDGAKGLDLLDELRDDISAPQAVQAGLTILRNLETKDEELPDALIKRVESWLSRGLREEPDLVALGLQQAELFDLQQRYEEAADAYRELLGRRDVVGQGRAVVLNNLAYLLALTTDDEASVSEAERYITEAVDLLGPGTAILDTRAVIAIADKRYEDAIEDLKLALIDAPTASKHFHLAMAYAKLGRADEAKLAWEDALGRGLTRESISRLEREQFDQTKQQIESGGLTAVAR